MFMEITPAAPGLQEIQLAEQVLATCSDNDVTDKELRIEYWSSSRRQSRYKDFWRTNRPICHSIKSGFDRWVIVTLGVFGQIIYVDMDNDLCYYSTRQLARISLTRA